MGIGNIFSQMITKMYKYIRLGLIIALMTGVTLLAVEVYFVVTNSNRPDFWPDEEGAPSQDMSSGLFSSYVHDDNVSSETSSLFSTCA